MPTYLYSTEHETFIKLDGKKEYAVFNGKEKELPPHTKLVTDATIERRFIPKEHYEMQIKK